MSDHDQKELPAITRDMYLQADERLLKEMTYNLIMRIDDKLDKSIVCHYSHIDNCNKRFAVIENNDKLKTTLAAFIGGIVVMIAAAVKNFLGK